MTEDAVDYAKCTVDELRDVQRHIDRHRFPERAKLVDDELLRRFSIREDTDAPSLRRNPLFVLGLITFGVAVLQFLVAERLDALGVIEIGNALGCGLVMWLGIVAAALLVVVGVMLHPRA